MTPRPILGITQPIIGMVHVPALPGTPFNTLPPDAIIDQVAREAELLAATGFDAIIVENMHDRPYVHANHPPVTTALMTRAALAARQAAPNLPLGVQILSGGNREALAVALALHTQDNHTFIRCENFVYAHVADEGLLERAEAGPLLRERAALNATHIPVFCDIKKKHASHAITADLDLADVAEGAHFFGADALIVSGTATGHPTDPADVDAVRNAVDLPVLVGSGVTPDTIPALLASADALIVGSTLKIDGCWENPLDKGRCAAIVDAVNTARA